MTARAGRFLAALAALAAAAGASGLPRASVPDAARVSARVRAYRSAHEGEIVRELAGLLGVPNVASDSPNIEKTADAVAAALERRGIHPERLRVDGAPPVVFGELTTPGASRTVILYAHYDGQPVEPKDWTGDPWRPTLRDKPLEAGGGEVPLALLPEPIPPEWRLYGRSASDDKAPIVGVLTALDALRTARIPLAVNVKLFFEGEEEAGSPHLAALLERYASRLGSDLWILFDGPVHSTRRMQVYFGARGITDLTLTIYGPLRRLHSGHYGNWAPNPIASLVDLLGGMRDRDGFVTIPGFADEIRPAGERERRAIAEAPDADGALRDELAIGRPEGRGEPLIAAIQRPALNLRGITGGDVGGRATNSIPTEASASIDFRLVPDQTLAGIRRAVEEYVRGRGYAIASGMPDAAARRRSPAARLQWGAGYPAYRTSMDLPVSRALLDVVSGAAGGPAVAMPMLGGSIPMYLFHDKLGTPVIGVPIANHDNNQHAANENLRIQNLWDGIEVYAALLARLTWDDPPKPAPR